MVSDVRTTASDEIDALLEGAAFYTDPYPVFSRLREESPVHWHRAAGAWLVSRHADAELVFRNPRQFSSYGFQNKYMESLRPDLRRAAPTLALRGRVPTLITSDPPNHTRLRRLLQVVFTPKAIESLRPKVVAIVRELVDEAAEGPEIDFVSALAYPLPATMIAEIMGVPRTDRDVFKKASTDIVAFMNRANPNRELTVEFAEYADRSLAEFREYLLELIAHRKKCPRSDIISTFVHSNIGEDEPLDEQEILWNLVLFLIAGHETTTNLIANGLSLLLAHPKQLALLRANRALLSAAIEEALRFESPVQRARRVASEDVQLGGRLISAGEPVEVLIGSANRDETRWVSPEQFDVTRSAVPNLAFGKGVHFCIGASLARLEASVAIGVVLNRFGRLELAQGWEPNWLQLTNLRTLRNLRVSVL